MGSVFCPGGGLLCLESGCYDQILQLQELYHYYHPLWSSPSPSHASLRSNQAAARPDIFFVDVMPVLAAAPPAKTTTPHQHLAALLYHLHRLPLLSIDSSISDKRVRVSPSPLLFFSPDIRPTTTCHVGIFFHLS
eukprot:TRINITY_DN8057_c0_g2_i4.p1 TRINITY_DN8057_c0_g2~~TRINITY_DN8057_c0_g2_i4.p1  ORF type:complete len:142 (+),score=8.78 TRINITY_DN8057_c0_g2_i4:23-427(+)